MDRDASRVGAWNHALDGESSHGEGAIVEVVRLIEKCWESDTVYAKVAEPTEMPFGG